MSDEPTFRFVLHEGSDCKKRWSCGYPPFIAQTVFGKALYAITVRFKPGGWAQYLSDKIRYEQGRQ